MPLFKNLNSTSQTEVDKESKSQTYKDRIFHIPIDKIKPNPYQPRKHFDKMALSELSNSIKEYGVLQPINVRKIPAGNYELVSGERRLKACKMANLKEIPAIVMEVADNDSAVLAMIENLQRQDLGFLEEAEGYLNLIEQHGFTQDQLSKKVSKSQSTIANKLRLLKLPSDVKQTITDNNLTERHARALLKLHDPQLQLKVLKTICERGLNVKASEDLIQKTIENLTKVASEKATSNIRQIRIFKDMRLYVNTLHQAVEMIKKSGIEATQSQTDYGDYIEYIVRLPKIRE